MDIVTTHSAVFGIAVICAAIGMARASFYRWQNPMQGAARPRVSPRALSNDERLVVLAILHEDRFVDLAPGEVYSTLLDEDRYLCSERTMYRVLAANQAVRERRDQLRHPAYAAPELLATRPNELWSWDITKLRGLKTWSYFYLYVIIDVFSRYVVGWMVADCESAALAEVLIGETCANQKIERNKLGLHADRGSSMKSKLVAMLLSDLGVTKTHSRPRVSDDNPYSEALFKTLKYRPAFPEKFGSIEDARAHCRMFFEWYNAQHHHSGIAMVTPEDMHYGRAADRVVSRTAVLLAAHLEHPERFVNGAPSAPPLPTAAYINKPAASLPEPTRPSPADASAPVCAIDASPERAPEHGILEAQASELPLAPGDAPARASQAHDGIAPASAVPAEIPPAPRRSVAGRPAARVAPRTSTARAPKPSRAAAERSGTDTTPVVRARSKSPVAIASRAHARARSGSACTPHASAAAAPARDAHALAALEDQTQGDVIPLHPQTVSPRRDSRRIDPRQNLTTDPETEVTRH